MNPSATLSKTPTSNGHPQPTGTRTMILINRAQLVPQSAKNELHAVSNVGQVVVTNISTMPPTPVTPVTRRPGTSSSSVAAGAAQAFICLPSPSSSPTPQRIIQYQLINRPATMGSQQHLQPSTSTNHGCEGSSEPDAPKLQAILSSPLPPAYPWNWAAEEDGGQNGVTSVHLSPISPARSAPSSPFNERSEPLTLNDTLETDNSEPLNSSELDGYSIGGSGSGVTRRGRPRLDDITSMIAEANHISTNIRCKFCSRTFPREKSLQAHLRTHTGERPYVCSHEGCGRAFAQSGQLRTHQRLHTGEKPFVCAFDGCNNRFTHANRHCNEHPAAGVRRDRSTSILQKPESASGSSSGYRRIAKKPPPIVPVDELENSPVKALKKQRAPGPAAIRLRSRRLRQELEAADDFPVKSQAQPASLPNTRTIIIRPASTLITIASKRSAEELNYVPKKKLAMLKLKQETFPATTSVATPLAPLEEAISDEKLEGALALIQLATGGAFPW